MNGRTKFKNSQVQKKAFLMLLFLSVVEFLYAQRTYDLTFLASPQVSWMTSDSKFIGHGKVFTGFGYGVEGDIFLHSDNYMIVTGLTISTAGGSLVYNTPVPFGPKQLPGGTTVNYYLQNLEVPLALKMRTRNFNRMRYFAQFGLTNWFNLKTKATSNEEGSSTRKEVIRKEIRFYNIGLNVGAGLEYELGRGNALTGGLIYSSGFVDATRNARINDATTLNVLRLRLGFVF